MPCTVTEDENRYYSFKDFDEHTLQLCALLRKLTPKEHNLLFKFTPFLRDWAEKHRAEDAARGESW